MEDVLPAPQSVGGVGPKQERYISVDEVVARLKARGISLGRGDPYHTLRYYTKIGLLPHMVRQVPDAEKLRYQRGDTQKLPPTRRTLS